jgi:hypothetical protein
VKWQAIQSTLQIATVYSLRKSSNVNENVHYFMLCDQRTSIHGGTKLFMPQAGKVRFPLVEMSRFTRCLASSIQHASHPGPEKIIKLPLIWIASNFCGGIEVRVAFNV